MVSPNHGVVAQCGTDPDRFRRAKAVRIPRLCNLAVPATGIPSQAEVRPDAGLSDRRQTSPRRRAAALGRAIAGLRKFDNSRPTGVAPGHRRCLKNVAVTVAVIDASIGLLA